MFARIVVGQDDFGLGYKSFYTPINFNTKLALKAEGWGWVETLPEMDYGYLSRFRNRRPKQIPLSKREEKRLERLLKRYDKLVAELEEEPPEETVAEIDRLADQITAMSEKREEWSEKDKARSGVIVTLDYHGRLDITRSLVRPKPPKEKKPSAAAAAERTSRMMGK